MMSIKISDKSREIEKCPSFLTCNAPMCLLDPKVETSCWYPDEEICKKNKPPLWIRNQKKIKKKAKDPTKYFTFEMLSQNCIIGKRIEGLYPDKPEEGQLKRWLKKHLTKSILSEKEKKVIRERFMKNIAKFENETSFRSSSQP